MGRGMAMTSGVFMNGVPWPAMAGSPWSASRWSRMAPQPLAAGDQMTGRGPSADSSHPSASSCMAAPEALVLGRTNTHAPSASVFVALKSLASSVSRSIFSEETATSTTTQSPGSPNSSWETSSEPEEQADATSSTTRARTDHTKVRRRG